MRAVRLLGLNDLHLCDVPIPDPAPGEVLIKVEACGICGTVDHLPWRDAVCATYIGSCCVQDVLRARLGAGAAVQRLERYGKNELPRALRRSGLAMFIDQFTLQHAALPGRGGDGLETIGQEVADRCPRPGRQGHARSAVTARLDFGHHAGRVVCRGDLAHGRATPIARSAGGGIAGIRSRVVGRRLVAYAGVLNVV